MYARFLATLNSTSSLYMDAKLHSNKNKMLLHMFQYFL